MMNALKLGWSRMLRNPGLLVLFFLYHGLWSYFLYRFVQAVALPLLHRYPADDLGDTAAFLYLFEGELRLTQTDAAYSLLWLLLGIALVRMVITPLLQAGLYHTVHLTALEDRTRSFRQGVRGLWKRFMLTYWIQSVLLVLPLFYLCPKLLELSQETPDWSSLVEASLPYLGTYVVYGGIIKLLCMYAQFGITARESAILHLGRGVYYLLPITLISVVVALTLMLSTALVSIVTAMWAGIIAVVIHQAMVFLQTMLKIWGLSAQHSYWYHKNYD